MRRRWTWSVAAVTALAIVGVRLGLHHAHRGAMHDRIADLALTNPLNQPGGDPAPADAYDIYSALYQEPSLEPLVFVEESETDIPQVDGSCLRPRSSEDQEMSDAFAEANRQTHRWFPRFRIAQGYSLISRSEATLARSCMDAHFESADQCERFKHIRHLRYLGVPGFNHARTRALVSVLRMCGSFCGSGGLFVVEKTASEWRRATPTTFTRDCSWMY